MLKPDDDILEVDYKIDVDAVPEGTRVRVKLEQCPHCGEWNAGPLGDDERYFCCGKSADPFMECAGALEIVGEVRRCGGGGKDLAEMVELLTDEDRENLRGLWIRGEDWLTEAERMLEERRGRSNGKSPLID